MRNKGEKKDENTDDKYTPSKNKCEKGIEKESNDKTI